MQAFYFTLLFLLIAVSSGWSQIVTDLHVTDVTEQNSAAPVASDAGFPEICVTDTDCDVDNSSDEPASAPSSFFMADALGIEGAETDRGLANYPAWGAYSRVLGGLHFLKIKHRFETAIDYRAGEFFHDTADAYPRRQIQELNATQLVLWKKGELSLADSMSNYAGGSFASPWFGGASLYNLNTGGAGAGIPTISGTSDLFGLTSFGGIGQGEHFTNISVAEVSQLVSPRSVFSAAAGYGITTFFDRHQNLIDSTQASGLLDYAYEISSKSEVGLAYSYRTFRFPKNQGSVVTSLPELTYKRQISPRFSIQVGVGPEFEKIKQLHIVTFPIVLPGGLPGRVSIPTEIHTNAINVSAFGSLLYRFRWANAALSYTRGVSSGSGFYAGANSNSALLSVSWLMFRTWNAGLTAGYAYLSQVAQTQSVNPTQSYQFWFTGLAVSRRLSKSWSAFAGYQYNNESFANTICASSVCNHVLRNSMLVGVRWRMHPIRLDNGNGQDTQITPLADQHDHSQDSIDPVRYEQ